MSSVAVGAQSTRGGGRSSIRLRRIRRSPVRRAGAPGLDDEGTRLFKKLEDFFATDVAYALELGAHPQTLYGIADSPVGLAAWMLDHDSTSLALISRMSFSERRPGSYGTPAVRYPRGSSGCTGARRHCQRLARLGVYTLREALGAGMAYQPRLLKGASSPRAPTCAARSRTRSCGGG